MMEIMGTTKLDKTSQIKMHSSEQFNEEVKKLSAYMSVLDAILAYCEAHELEYETVKKLIGTDLKRLLRKEAEDLNFIPKTSRLPI
jgi:hypothetical protein